MLRNEMDNNGSGLLDLAEEKEAVFLENIGGRLERLRETTNKRETTIESKELAAYLWEMIKDSISTIYGPSTEGSITSILFHGRWTNAEGIPLTVEEEIDTLQQIPLFNIQNSLSESDLDDICSGTFTFWEDDKEMSRLLTKSCIDSTDPRRQSARINIIKKRIAAINKLTDIYANTYNALIPYLPSGVYTDSTDDEPEYNVVANDGLISPGERIIREGTVNPDELTDEQLSEMLGLDPSA